MRNPVSFTGDKNNASLTNNNVGDYTTPFFQRAISVVAGLQTDNNQVPIMLL
jgi:hypothetical protein